VPLAENVEVQAAVRAFHYNTFGSDYTYKFGGRWSPIRDFTVRGTYSTAFRAPNILELFQGLAAGNFESSNDPCADTHGDAALAARCNAAPGSAGGPGTADNGVTVAQINSANGGSPGLQPEKAKIGTIGVVFEPQQVRGFTLTTDFYRISLRQLIGNYGTQFIVNKCYGAGGFGQDVSFCNLITRDPSTKEVIRVTDANVNIGEQLTTGIDLGAQYSMPTDFGRFVFRFNGNYLIKMDYKGPGGIYIKGAGNYDGQGVVTASGSTNFNPRVKFNTGVNYSLGGLSTGVLARFIGPLTECAPAGGTVNGAATGPGFCFQNAYPPHSVSAQWTFDLLASYRLKTPAGSSMLALGIRNLTNQRPPRLYDSFLTYADPDYDFVGRFFYGRIEHKF
jgi:outer membrane receptor protein involved in Fe transport